MKSEMHRDDEIPSGVRNLTLQPPLWCSRNVRCFGGGACDRHRMLDVDVSSPELSLSMLGSAGFDGLVELSSPPQIIRRERRHTSLCVCVQEMVLDGAY